MKSTSSNPRRIVIFGNSILLVGIAESLRINPALEVVELHSKEEKSLLNGTRPDLVIVDAAQTPSSLLAELMSFLSFMPGLPFISLHADTKQLTIHSTQQYPAVSQSDLTQVIDKLSQYLPNPN